MSLGFWPDRVIASSLLTIIDDGTLEKGPATAPFDGEGVPTSRRPIVENGVLRGFMYNPDLPESEGRYKAVFERRFTSEEEEPGASISIIRAMA